MKGKEGMSLRDAFAIAALPGCMAGARKLAEEGVIQDDLVSGAAHASFEIADAMLAEREK
mgnify:CR=1 FL=1